MSVIAVSALCPWRREPALFALLYLMEGLRFAFKTEEAGGIQSSHDFLSNGCIAALPFPSLFILAVTGYVLLTWEMMSQYVSAPDINCSVRHGSFKFILSHFTFSLHSSLSCRGDAILRIGSGCIFLVMYQVPSFHCREWSSNCSFYSHLN